MVKVRIFIEGGGDGKVLDGAFKYAWWKFFTAAGLDGKMPAIVRGEGRSETFRKFQNTPWKPRELRLLLVDSEGPVDANHTAWQHLKARPADNWDRPEWAADDSAYLMVQFMETWFLADREALRRFFGQSFNANPFREWPSLEAVPKATVLSALERATGGRYRKGMISFQLLGMISPDKVAAACPHAKQLLDYLRNLPSAA